MKQIFPDLWQTNPEQPLPNVPELVTRAYLVTRPDGNLLFYSTGLEDEHRAIQSLGGAARQYLSHVDEAGPALAAIKARFGSELWGHEIEAEAVRRRSGVAPDRTFSGPEIHLDNLEVMPLPGHTASSTSYLYRSPHGRTYLFTGDTIGRDSNGVWTAGYLPFSDRAKLIAALRHLATLRPDVILSSAFGGRHPYAEVTAESWRAAVDEALMPLTQTAA